MKSLTRKLWMSVTGLFLCLFLVVHLAGNILLLFPAEEARSLYNAYSAALTSSKVIKVISIVLYASIIAHAAVSVVLAVSARRARGRVRYARERPSATSPWAARSMELLGVVLLVFLVIHMRTFWFTYHWGAIGIDDHGNKDLYGVVVEAFSRPWYVLLYVGSMAALAIHLYHGVESGFRTLGLHHHRFLAVVGWLGRAFAIAVGALFSLLPVWVHFTSTLGG